MTDIWNTLTNAKKFGLFGGILVLVATEAAVLQTPLGEGLSLLILYLLGPAIIGSAVGLMVTKGLWRVLSLIIGVCLFIAVFTLQQYVTGASKALDLLIWGCALSGTVALFIFLGTFPKQLLK